MKLEVFCEKLGGLVLRDTKRENLVSSSALLWPHLESQHSDISCVDFPHQAVLQFSANTNWVSYSLTQCAWR